MVLKKSSVGVRNARIPTLLCCVLSFCAPRLLMAQAIAPNSAGQTDKALPSAQKDQDTTQAWNRRLDELLQSAKELPAHDAQEYRIGAEDLLEITVFGAAELNRSVRVTAGGTISLPLLGSVRAAGLTPRELEFVLQELLRRRYMQDPQVGVFVRELESRPLSVFGAVKKPGVFQIRGTKTLLEVLSMAEGLADDAGDTVTIMRNSGPQPAGTQDANGSQPAPEERKTLEINLKDLLAGAASTVNVPVLAGDIVTVSRAGVVYVVGEVRKPGGFLMKNNESISVLQALALAEGITRTSAKSQARIIRTHEKTGERTEIPINLDKILNGKLPDPILQPRDIIFVPGSAARGALYRGTEAAISIVSGVLVFRR